MTGIDLNGDWRLSIDEGARPPRAQWPMAVPGDVTAALVRADVLPDPRRGIGVLSAAWVATKTWRASRDFEVPRDVAGARAWLVFDDLSPAMIELNGRSPASESGPCRIDVTRKFKPGRNTLTLALAEGSAGVIGAARMEYTREPVRMDITSPLVTVAENLESATVRVRQHVEVFDKPTSVQLMAQLPEAGVFRDVQAQLAPGMGIIELELSIKQPKLWWPAGHGPHNLYTLMVTLLVAGRDIDRRSIQIGFRHISHDTESGGRLWVNRQRIGIVAASLGTKKGTGGVSDPPGGKILPVLELSRESGVNLLRTAPLDEAFLKQCDHAGMLIVPDSDPPIAHPSLLQIEHPEQPQPSDFTGPRALPTIRDCLGDNPAAHALAWSLHDDSGIALPNPLEEHVLFEGIAHGEALSRDIEDARLARRPVEIVLTDPHPLATGAGIVDGAMRRTPAFWYVKRAAQPIHVVIRIEDDQVVISGLNDTPRPYAADLRFGLFSFDGGYVMNRSVRVTLDGAGVTRLVSFPRAKWKNPTATGAFALLTRIQRFIARNCLLLDGAQIPEAVVNARVENGQAIFTSPTFARGVCIDLSGEIPFADNFIDVYPGIAHAIAWKDAAPPAIVT